MIISLSPSFRPSVFPSVSLPFYSARLDSHTNGTRVRCHRRRPPPLLRAVSSEQRARVRERREGASRCERTTGRRARGEREHEHGGARANNPTPLRRPLPTTTPASQPEERTDARVPFHLARTLGTEGDGIGRDCHGQPTCGLASGSHERNG